MQRQNEFYRFIGNISVDFTFFHFICFFRWIWLFILCIVGVYCSCCSFGCCCCCWKGIRLTLWMVGFALFTLRNESKWRCATDVSSCTSVKMNILPFIITLMPYTRLFWLVCMSLAVSVVDTNRITFESNNNNAYTHTRKNDSQSQKCIRTFEVLCRSVGGSFVAINIQKSRVFLANTNNSNAIISAAKSKYITQNKWEREKMKRKTIHAVCKNKIREWVI